ncbi:Anti-sigma factor [Sphingobium herbicidovorans NBRC 16415]|uniref:Anti-sigma factor n=1 Tax=Sphingobium herbicidovorans (strain ATCC 700291 / DSM 11019 / CCUG 56400 / KCTC 2939 / LMG 18315 / NBRC 16415 / MH) TaxID=1219045 RepID=A0A086PD10_SPHHM|nr:hypothetical protein [Sphingobium herbicidovorans]KFG91278.1 Anti-sigma factor [Sphingobium herbicidovorans NBRC 16415]
MTDIDEAMLIAWVDGELDDVTRRRVERAVADDPALAARLEMHRRLRQRISGHYAPVAAEPLPTSLHMLLSDSAKVAPLTRPMAVRWRNWGIGGAIAASLILGLGIGRMSGGLSGPVAVTNDGMVAKGLLASALDTQLASAQEGAPIRIGLSFRREGGGWCRSFEGRSISGVACREGQGWQVRQLISGQRSAADYRQASSDDSRILATVDALMEGAPADAVQEKAARAKGWR